MSVDGIIGEYIENLPDFVTGLMTFFGGVFVAGVLVAFIAWAIGFAVHSVYRWLYDTTSDERRD